jgi:TRAP-type mannitol/chloroaromatic compound transport system substrate-binding protein
MLRNLTLSLLILLGSCGGTQEPVATDRATPAAPQKIYEWRMVTTWPKNLPGMGIAPETMAKKIKTMSNGRLDIKVYGAGEIVPALEVFEAVSQGTVQMGHGAAYYWKGKVPIAQFFTALPFGLTAQEINGWLFHGGGMELWRELYAKYNLVPVAGGNTGVQMAGWFNKEINSLDDLKGMKMRIPGLGGEVFSRVGGTAVNLPGGEIFTSMQTGVIDATEWVGPYNDLAFGLHQVAKYYYYPGWQEPGPNLELIINKEAWDGLPPDLQAIVENASLVVSADLLAEYTARNNAALRELVDIHGVQLRQLPADVLQKIRKISYAMTEEIVDPDDELANRIYNSYQTYRDGVLSYHEISERAYINARAAE